MVWQLTMVCSGLDDEATKGRRERASHERTSEALGTNSEPAPGTEAWVAPIQHRGALRSHHLAERRITGDLFLLFQVPLSFFLLV